MSVTVQNIQDASAKLSEVSKKTPLDYSRFLSERYDANIYLKREDLQEIRSYKIRGSYNMISSLEEPEKHRGVVCASAGNHAQGVALACAKLQIKGVIFMPVNTPKQKVDKVKKFGEDWIEIHILGETYTESSYLSKEYAKDHNMVVVSAFNNEKVIAGQGTVGLEIVEDLPETDIIVCPIGGGGLISGVSTYTKSLDRDIKIIGVEPVGSACMHTAIKKDEVVMLKNIDTFCDGVAVKEAGDITFEIVKELVDGIEIVDEGLVATMMIDLYQNSGIVAEPAGALSISGLENIKEEIKGKNVVCVISGGNNDILRYPEIMERSLVWQGKKHYFIVEFEQKPGQLRKLVEDVIGPDDDISRFEYIKKTNKAKGAALVGIQLQDKNDYNPLIERFERSEIEFIEIRTSDLLYQYLV